MITLDEQIRDQEAKLKHLIYERDVNTKTSPVDFAQTGSCVQGSNESYQTISNNRLMLSERLRKQSIRNKQNERKERLLEELVYLLDKYPEISRILDILDEVKEDV